MTEGQVPLRAAAFVVTGGLAATYLVGWARLRRGRQRATVPPLAWYLAGLAAILVALFSPLDGLVTRLLTAHMIQHALLMIVAPPLLLLANPLPVALWAFPRAWRRRLARPLAAGARTRAALRALTQMPATWSLSTVVFWAWHLPPAYEAALRHGTVHDVEHVSFFVAGVLFWWPVVNPAPRVHGHIAYVRRLLYVISAQAVGVLPCFAIAGFARDLLYPDYAAMSGLWGLGPLEDQSIAWGLMGALEAIATGIAFLAVFHAMASYEERRLPLHFRRGLDPAAVPDVPRDLRRRGA